MPSIIMSNMHQRTFDAFCLLFNAIGWKVFIPAPTEPNPFGYGQTNTPMRGEWQVVTYQEFLDIKPDVLLCSCWEQLPGAYKMAKQSGSKLVVHAGNNHVPYNKSHASFLTSNDTYTYQSCDIPNKVMFYLPPDYEFYHKQPWQSDSRIVTSYIHYYSKYWKASWSKYDNLRRLNPDIAFINFGAPGDEVYSPSITQPVDVRRTLGISRCLLHIKEQEGYGWSLLEAIATGIPVIAPKAYVVGKTCEMFLVEGKSVIFLQKDTNEFRKAFDNVELLQQIADTGSRFVRELISPEENYMKIKKFFEEVVLA
jgi:hypothetical protein